MSNKNILLPVAIILIIFVFATISVFAWRNHWFSSLKVLILKLFRHSKTSPPNHDYQNDQSESQNSKLNGQ